MGKVLSVLNRKANRFNVENRAHRIISKDKPTPAPRHPSNVQELHQIYTDHPEIAEETQKKHAKLDERLKQVYVVSHDPEVPALREPSKSEATIEFDRQRKLPLDRQPHVEDEYGFQEPAVIPRGRFTLRQAIKFISDHQADPKTWTSASIAKEYELSEEKLDKVLQHFRTFEVFIPQKKDKTREALMANPSVGRKLEAGSPGRDNHK